jgi:hypothetical protein
MHTLPNGPVSAGYPLAFLFYITEVPLWTLNTLASCLDRSVMAYLMSDVLMLLVAGVP